MIPATATVRVLGTEPMTLAGVVNLMLNKDVTIPLSQLNPETRQEVWDAIESSAAAKRIKIVSVDGAAVDPKAKPNTITPDKTVIKRSGGVVSSSGIAGAKAVPDLAASKTKPVPTPKKDESDLAPSADKSAVTSTENQPPEGGQSDEDSSAPTADEPPAPPAEQPPAEQPPAEQPPAAPPASPPPPPPADPLASL